MLWPIACIETGIEGEPEGFALRAETIKAMDPSTGTSQSKRHNGVEIIRLPR
jgi:hypothetical protein